jgi:hypothetical protein
MALPAQRFTGVKPAIVKNAFVHQLRLWSNAVTA